MQPVLRRMSTMWTATLWFFDDDRLERTTNGSGYLLDHDFDTLRALDAGDGERIPTLSRARDRSVSYL